MNDVDSLIRNVSHAFRQRVASLRAKRNRLSARHSIRAFIITFVAVMVVVVAVAYLLHLPLRIHGEMTPGNQLLMRGALCGAVLLATWVAGWFDGRPWYAYGLRARHGGLHFVLGLLAGATAFALMMAALVWSGGATVRQPDISTGFPIGPAILWAVVFLLVGWSEELIFRGYLFFRLAREKGAVHAAIRSSLMFGFVHLFNHGESPLGIVQVVLFGLVACFAIWRTGSLWWAAGMHAAWDWSESFLFGTEDSGLTASGHWLTSHAIGASWLSGGVTGPEASLLAIPAVGVLALFAWLLLPRGDDALSRTALAK